jgi:hypothetical protein
MWPSVAKDAPPQRDDLPQCDMVSPRRHLSRSGQVTVSAALLNRQGRVRLQGDWGDRSELDDRRATRRLSAD